MATSPPPHRPRSSLPRKLVLLFLLIIAAAFGIIFLFKAGQPMPYLYLISLGAALLGLTAGFGARFILKRRHAALRLLAAFIALTVGLVILGLFTDYGLDPLTLNRENFDWTGVLQLVIGGISIVLSMFAWYKPEPVFSIDKKPTTQPMVFRSKPKPKPLSDVISKVLKRYDRIG